MLQASRKYVQQVRCDLRGRLRARPGSKGLSALLQLRPPSNLPQWVMRAIEEQARWQADASNLAQKRSYQQSEGRRQQQETGLNWQHSLGVQRIALPRSTVAAARNSRRR